MCGSGMNRWRGCAGHGGGTGEGLAQLRTFLSEVPADRFRSPLKVVEIPRLFTVETFCKLVIRAQRAG